MNDQIKVRRIGAAKQLFSSGEQKVNRTSIGVVIAVGELPR